MSVRRRRLAGTASLGVAAWTLFASLIGPPALALDDPPAEARPAAQPAPAAPGSSLLALEMVQLRPLVLLRQPGEPGAVIAHRGDSALAPENTMPAFASTAAAGADFFEIDVRLSKDGVPVVIHDSTVDRTTDGTGEVAELELADLRALDAGSWFSDEFAGARIPTLEEVLALAAGTGAHVVIEYKGAWSRSDIRTTVGMIAAAGLERRVVAQSFSAKTVANFSAVAPALTVGWLTDGIDRSIIAMAQAIGADAVNPSSATRWSVAMAHRAGLGVLVWTQDVDTAWAELTRMGVDGIITNVPGDLHAWMQAAQPEPEPRTAFMAAAA